MSLKTIMTTYLKRWKMHENWEKSLKIAVPSTWTWFNGVLESILDFAQFSSKLAHGT